MFSNIPQLFQLVVVTKLVQAIPNVLILVYVPVRMDTKEPNVMLIAVVIP